MMTGVHGLNLHEYEVEHFLMNRKLYQSEKMLAIFRLTLDIFLKNLRLAKTETYLYIGGV